MTAGGGVTLPITGGCNCGAVRFEVTEPFEASMYCHCTRCQRRTGTAASVNARTAPRRFASCGARTGFGPGNRRTPARRSTSAVIAAQPCSAAAPARSGSGWAPSTATPGSAPTYRQYVAYAAAWEPIPDDGLPRHPQARGA